jgi:ABC-2 type transport system permease protein
MPIFDQGYQHWQGPLAGYQWRWLAVARHGIKATLKGKIVKIMLLGAWMPAIILVVILAMWGLLEQQAESVLNFLKQTPLPPEFLAKPQEYRSAVWTILYNYFFQAELFWTVLLVLAVGPSLISKDLRFNALPLYFSRPIRRIDYFVGKLGVIAFFIAATTIVPAVVAYISGIAFSLDLSVIRDTHRLLWGSLLYGLIITLSAGTLMLAMSSLTRRSIYVGITWAGFCLLTAAVSGILIGIQVATQQQELTNAEMEKWMADHPPPEGVEMRNNRPVWRGRHFQMDPSMSETEKVAFKWRQEWLQAYGKASNRAEEKSGQDAMANADWRPAISYTTNLSHVGGTILDVESAWLLIGRTIEKPRAAAAPMIAFKSGGRVPKDLLQPANERRLAEQFVPQFPWQMSAGVLFGLWLFSVMVLATRVKSLDRLK